MKAVFICLSWNTSSMLTRCVVGMNRSVPNCLPWRSPVRMEMAYGPVELADRATKILPYRTWTASMKAPGWAVSTFVVALLFSETRTSAELASCWR